MTTDNRMYQIVILIMADGKKLHFTGPAGAKEGDMIVDIKFSEPMPLPADFTWWKIKEDGGLL